MYVSPHLLSLLFQVSVTVSRGTANHGPELLGKQRMANGVKGPNANAEGRGQD